MSQPSPIKPIAAQTTASASANCVLRGSFGPFRYRNHAAAANGQAHRISTKRIRPPACAPRSLVPCKGEELTKHAVEAEVKNRHHNARPSGTTRVPRFTSCDARYQSTNQKT